MLCVLRWGVAKRETEESGERLHGLLCCSLEVSVSRGFPLLAGYVTRCDYFDGVGVVKVVQRLSFVTLCVIPKKAMHASVGGWLWFRKGLIQRAQRPSFQFGVSLCFSRVRSTFFVAHHLGCAQYNLLLHGDVGAGAGERGERAFGSSKQENLTKRGLEGSLSPAGL